VALQDDTAEDGAHGVRLHALRPALKAQDGGLLARLGNPAVGRALTVRRRWAFKPGGTVRYARPHVISIFVTPSEHETNPGVAYRRPRAGRRLVLMVTGRRG
jgi:hypothetical protein